MYVHTHHLPKQHAVACFRSVYMCVYIIVTYMSVLVCFVYTCVCFVVVQLCTKQYMYVCSSRRGVMGVKIYAHPLARKYIHLSDTQHTSVQWECVLWQTRGVWCENVLTPPGGRVYALF